MIDSRFLREKKVNPVSSKQSIGSRYNLCFPKLLESESGFRNDLESESGIQIYLKSESGP